MKLINLDLSKFANGSLQEQVDIEAKTIFKNILDPNAKPGAKRNLTIKLTFEPDEDVSGDVKVKFDIATKLAPIVGGATKMRAGRDANTGQIGAAEIVSGIPGQTFIDDEGELRTDTGEKVEDVEKKETKILDLQAKRG